MIRRKIWATATFCLAVAAAARAQTGSTTPANPATPGSESPSYNTRSGVPNPGYPRFIPRNYTPPSAPSYRTPTTDLGPASSGAVSAPAESFAIESDATATTSTPAPAAAGPAPASPMTGGTLIQTPAPAPAAAPMEPPVIDATVQSPGPFPPGGVYGGPVVPGPALNGGPILDSPYLNGMADCGGALPCVWVSGEYLNWRLQGVTVPPIITTAPAGFPGTLFDANTTVVFGGSRILDNWQSGFRIRAGMWFPDGASGIDLAFFNLDPASERHTFASNGAQGLFRPFFNRATSSEDARDVAFTDPVLGPIGAGTVTAVAQTMLWGAEANYRTGWGMGLGGRLDALVGYRYLQLHDRLTVDSRATLVAPGVEGTVIASSDRFDTTNMFNGAQVGFVGEWQIGLMTFGLRGTIAAGCTTQTVDISGATSSIAPGGALVTTPGSVFAQTTNIGNHTRSQFSFVPEIGATLGCQVTNNIRVFAGYNVLCWTNVVRAGGQINRAVNGTFIADPLTGAVAPSGAPAPLFHYRDEHFYAHGYSLGVEFRW